jgi:hypothetical protein
MNTHKGIVFETTTAYSIFLTSDGLFEKGIPLTSSVQIGEEVYFRPYQNMKQQKAKHSFKSRWTTPILSVVATIVLLFSVLLPAQSNVSAYVQIDINPSIELGINKAGNVYSFKGLNDDGVGIKRDISFWKGKPLSWVLLQIVDRTESLIEETEVVEITTIYQNDMDHETLEKVIETAVATSASQALPKKQAIKVTEATVSDWKSATNKGVSVQKYQDELKKKNKDKLEKVKDKVKGKVKSETKNRETNKKQDNSKVIEKDLKEKKEPKNEKINLHNKSLKTDKPNDKKVQEKQKVNQNKVNNEKPKEKQKVNEKNNKKEHLKTKNKSKQLANKQSNSTNTKDSNSHIVKKDNKVKGNEKKDKLEKVNKKVKKEKIKQEKRGNAKGKIQKDDKPKR